MCSAIDIMIIVVDIKTDNRSGFCSIFDLQLLY